MNIITNITGIVVKGRQEGRKIGFPTANITIDHKLNDLKELKMGIYAGRIKVGNQWHDTATYYGKALTYNFDTVVLESHILDFEDDIYGQQVELEIVQFVRPVVKFQSVEELTNQIKLDCKKCKEILSQTNQG